MSSRDDGGAACGRCDEAGFRIQGHQWLCRKHYRFAQMRSNAKQRGKTVPTEAELEALLRPGFRCGDCDRPMNWLSKTGRSTVVSLQHYRDGSLGLVCLSCNSRHAHMEGDSYREMPKDHKRCPGCLTIKPLTDFTSDAGRRGDMQKRSYCKPCASARHTEWQRNNRDHYNATQRAGRARRKAELSKPSKGEGSCEARRRAQSQPRGESRT